MLSTVGQLREILLNEFTEAEVSTLCDKLGLNYTKLPGTGLFGKTRELLAIVQQNDHLSHLQAHMRAMRPHAFGRTGLGTHSDSRDEDPDEGASNDMNDASKTHTSQDEDPQSEHSEEDGAYEDDSAPEPLVSPAGRRTRTDRGNGYVSRETGRTYEVVPQPRTLLPLFLIAAILVLAGLIVFLPGLLRGNNAAVPAPTTAPPLTSSIPVIDAPNTAQIPTPVNVPQVNSTTNPSGVVIVATPAPISNSPASATNAQPTMPVIAAPNGTNAQPSAASQTVQNANAILPAYYRGEVGEDQITQFWGGKAFMITTDWNTSLPNVLKLGSAPRSTIQVTYEFVKAPTITSSRAGTHTIVTREYWAYANPANGLQLCDTRDYSYSVLEVNGKFIINAVTSRLVDKKCR